MGDDDITEIYFGKSNAYIVMTIDHENNIAIMKDMTHGGMQRLIQTSLKWCSKEYPFIIKIYFNDILSPEKLVLTEGQTWYMKYFGAVPCSQTKTALRKYLRIHKLYKEKFQALPKDAWNEKNIKATLSDLEYHQLSGSSWYITSAMIRELNILQNEGGSVKSFPTITNIWRSYPPT